MNSEKLRNVHGVRMLTATYIIVNFLLVIYWSSHYISQGELAKFLPSTCLLGTIISEWVTFYMS